MSADLEWTQGCPRSLRYGDIYFSRSDGLAESRAVFLEGCGLPHGWSGRARFTVAELGFGTGLNIAALLELWRRTREPGAHLSIFSVEAHPLSRDQAARALGAWRGVLGDAVDALLTLWPEVRTGFQRLDLLAHAATLDVYIGDVGEALARWGGPADAWFLDGFSPALNPQMWTGEVLAAVGRLSTPGARLATFTVAGPVRRGLVAAGFEVEKRPGFGAKRERLEGRLVAQARSPSSSRRTAVGSVAIVGGGIAAAALVRAFSRQGVACTLIEAEAPGAGASGNPSALVTPRLDAGFGPAADLHAQAFAFAVGLYRRDAPQAIIAEGVLQLGVAARDEARFAKLAAWTGFAEGRLNPMGPADLADWLAEDDTGDNRPALWIADALVVEPALVLRAWLASADHVTGTVVEVEPQGERWACRGRRSLPRGRLRRLRPSARCRPASDPWPGGVHPGAGLRGEGCGLGRLRHPDPGRRRAVRGEPRARRLGP